MKCLSEKEVRELFKESFSSSDFPKVYFKKVTCRSHFLVSGKRKLSDGALFSGFKSGKTYDLWIVEGSNQQLAVFVPGFPDGFVVEFSEFDDSLMAPDSFEASFNGMKYRLIMDSSRQRLLVPEWCFSIDEVEKRYHEEYAYWCAELVAEKDQWYVGWAFYRYQNDSSYPDGKRKWQAFFRIDTQEFVSQEECDASYDKLKVPLSAFPVKIGNMHIQFLFPNVINFEFI